MAENRRKKFKGHAIGVGNKQVQLFNPLCLQSFCKNSFSASKHFTREGNFKTRSLDAE